MLCFDAGEQCQTELRDVNISYSELFNSFMCTPPHTARVVPIVSSLTILVHCYTFILITIVINNKVSKSVALPLFLVKYLNKGNETLKLLYTESVKILERLISWFSFPYRCNSMVTLRAQLFKRSRTLSSHCILSESWPSE